MGGASLAQDATVSSQATAAAPSATGTSISDTSSTLTAYGQERQTLIQEWDTLVSQGATPQQIQAWRQQNAANFALQQQRAEALSAADYYQPMLFLPVPYIPANASATLHDFLTTRTAMANARAQIHNQLVQSLAPGATPQQVDQLQQQEQQAFLQQFASDIQLQSQRAQELAAQAGREAFDPPVPSAIPPDATPQLKAFLAARDALRASWIQVWNDNLSADPDTLQAALGQWRQQNAAAILQLGQLQSNLSASTQ